MKRCPDAQAGYTDDTLLYCLDDGNALLEGPASAGVASDEPPTREQAHMTDKTAMLRQL